MLEREFKDFLSSIKKDYSIFCIEKDKQSLFYINQMTDLFYNELIYQVYNKEVLYDLVYNIFKKNLVLIYSNMIKYTEKLSKGSIGTINELINVSTRNRFVDLENLNNLYKNFSFEINKNFSIDDKIEALISANIDVFTGELYSKLVINNRGFTDAVISKYKDIFKKEMINNINSKKENILSLYRNFIDSILNEVYEKKDEVKAKNLELVINIAYLGLKEREYININKYIDENIKLINEIFDLLEIDLKNIGINKNNKYKINPVKDYLLGFNNTINVKIKNLFDEMNLIVELENKETDKKAKEFNSLITHIFEMNLVFDKQFEDYKKQYNVLNKDLAKFEEIISSKKRALTDGIKANIFNIFRENIKIFNDGVYRVMLLKGKIDEYSTVLDSDKIKDLLFK